MYHNFLKYRYSWLYRVVQHYGVRGLDVTLDLVCLGEHHLGHVVGVGAHLNTNLVSITNSGRIVFNPDLKLACLRVQGEVIKPHWADEVDVCRLHKM